ncbi:YcxB family protein [Streptomyces sp. NPDC090022]|uniref:YcxB family protein n=1 Tax=Streptomyces sp. NPDC090022 TaxID=3365920 RepID=UPI0037F328F3
MTSGGEHTMTGRSVELVYRTTAADVAAALRTRAGHTPAGRRQRLRLTVLGVVMPMLTALLAQSEGAFAAPVVVCGLVTLVVWALMGFGPELQARALAPALAGAGETRTLVDDSGLCIATAGTRTRIAWSAQPAYVETDDLFLMLSDDPRGVRMTILPKRGAPDAADVEQLRTLLYRNLKRL